MRGISISDFDHNLIIMNQYINELRHVVLVTPLSFIFITSSNCPILVLFSHSGA